MQFTPTRSDGFQALVGGIFRFKSCCFYRQINLFNNNSKIA
jgi:hypothetical protein